MALPAARHQHQNQQHSNAEPLSEREVLAESHPDTAVASNGEDAHRSGARRAVFGKRLAMIEKPSSPVKAMVRSPDARQ
ncbi:hypothetical protein MMC14_001241 [Varicellaria rhodocarpa]|nr:hypothetical protein [Varicellaria rhodocarpa]